jgi:VanZ family protein
MANKLAPDSFFSSPRERRLWTWIAVLVVGIYATLGLVAPLAEHLEGQGLAVVVFWTVMASIGLTVLFMGLRARPGGLEIGIGIGLIGVYLMMFLRITIAERSHLMEYSILAVFIYEAFRERAKHRRIPVPALLAIGLTIVIGVIDELIQLFLPSRVFNPQDIIFNVSAAVVAGVGMAVLGWARRFAPRSRKDDREAP